MEDKREFDNPVCTTVTLPFFAEGNSKVTDIHYDLWTLRITISLNERKAPVYVIFKDVMGFRVLDEGDLLEFWNPETRLRGWLWVVESGGWFSLEKLRKGFLQGYNEDINHKEYLILGDNDCINILTLSEPIIIDSE